MPALLPTLIAVLVLAFAGFLVWNFVRKRHHATANAPSRVRARLQGHAPSSGPVVYAFVSDGCGACEAMKPKIAEAAGASSVEIVTASLSVGDPAVTEMVRENRVTRVPTLLRFDGAGAPRRYDGDRSVASIVTFAETGRSK